MRPRDWLISIHTTWGYFESTLRMRFKRSATTSTSIMETFRVEEMFSRYYYVPINTSSKLKYSSTLYCVARRTRVLSSPPQ